MSDDERVLCIPRAVIDQIVPFQGLKADLGDYVEAITGSSQLVYLQRKQAETAWDYKQLIPYVILMHEGRVLRYQRGTGGEENRLHGFYSIGVGGHISRDDSTLFSEDVVGYYDGMWREVREEVSLEHPRSEAVVALINDDSTEVGKVHFGIVHVVTMESAAVIGGRKGIVAPEFVSPADAVKEADRYESWSRLCLEHFDDLMARAATSASTDHLPL